MSHGKARIGAALIGAIIFAAALVLWLHPGLRVERLIAKGDRELLKGRSEVALSYYKQAFEIQPDHYRPHFRIGKTLMSLGQLEQADFALTRAAEIAPDEPGVQINLAYLKILGNRPAEAWPWIRAALRADPKFQEAMVLAAATGKRKFWFQQQLGVNPNQLMTRLSLADMLMAEGEESKALELYRGSLGLEDGANIEVYSRMGDGLLGRGRRGEAVQAYERALALAPYRASALLGMGLAKMNDKPEEARGFLQRVLEISPQGPHAESARKALAEMTP